MELRAALPTINHKFHLASAFESSSGSGAFVSSQRRDKRCLRSLQDGAPG